MSKLDGTRIDHFPPGARHAAREVRQARAYARAAKFAPVPAEIRAAGVTKLEGIAGGTRWARRPYANRASSEVRDAGGAGFKAAVLRSPFPPRGSQRSPRHPQTGAFFRALVDALLVSKN
jgi:hypothetical protein